MTIHVQDHELTLLPEKALLLDHSLILADTHFGKSAAFRARGIPVPEGDTDVDSDAILALAERHQPERLVIAGDFLHAPQGKSPAVLETLGRFFTRLSCETHLVLGNHDLHAGALPAEWSVTVHQSLALGPFTVVHDPDDLSSAASAKEDAPAATFFICGHLHPVARIRDGANTSFRTPCFWLRKNRLVLPSFGSFTGGAIVHPAAHDRVFGPLHDRVVEIPPEAF